MARPLRLQFPDASYHVMGRGLEKRSIFTRKSDYEDFIQRLSEAHSRFHIEIYAYCLMRNHYHLFINTPKANLSRAMRHINSSYTTYFNKSHDRCGPLLQGRYKAVVVHEASYALRLARYIHMNPVKAKLCADPAEYKHSSFRYLIADNPFAKRGFLNRSWFERFLDFGSNETGSAIDAYVRYVREGAFDEWDPGEGLHKGVILGDDEFASSVLSELLPQKKPAEISNVNKIYRKESDFVIAPYLKMTGDLPFSSKDKKKILVYLLKKYTPLTLSEISCAAGKQISYSAVSQIARRLERNRKENMHINLTLSKIERKCEVKS